MHSRSRVEGRGTSPAAHPTSGSEANTGDSHNLCVPCKGQSEWNKRGQRQSEVKFTRAAEQPSKLSGRPMLGPKQREEEEEIGGGALREERQDVLGTWDSETLMCVCLLVPALLSLAALLIPGFGDVKSFFHLFPCQLCSRYLQPSAHFRFR